MAIISMLGCRLAILTVVTPGWVTSQARPSPTCLVTLLIPTVSTEVRWLNLTLELLVRQLPTLAQLCLVDHSYHSNNHSNHNNHSLHHHRDHQTLSLLNL